MSRLTFWKAWPSSQKHLYQSLLFLLGLSILTCIISSFWSSRMVIQWETISKVSPIPLVLQSWEFATIPLNIGIDQYLITQIFEGSDLTLAQWPAHLLLLVLATCLVVSLALAVDLSRFWFMVSQVAFIFIMVGFKLEQLLLFDRTDKVALILAFMLYLPASYYFHAIRKESPLATRVMVFGVLTLFFGLVVYFFSGVSNPFLYIVNYGIAIPLGLTVVFILLTAHEIIYGFLVLITRNNTPESSNSFIHFLAISLIFLVNVLLLYLRNTRRIDWDFYYLDAYWILMAAAIIGIWGLRERGALFGNIIPLVPHALVGYLTLAIISFVTIGYFFTTANDPAIEAMEDIIVFSQLSIGFIFLIYILFNFRGVLIINLKVYKVVYKPTKMPFFSMRLGGFIGVLGLFLLSNQYPLDQAITAYYNGIGDLHRIDEQPLLAKEYYKLAAIYAKTNHRSNYAIASMERENQDISQALVYYKQSTIKQPTPFAYVNTARAYDEQGMFFKAVFTLKDGIKEFPGEPHLSNNLAILYAKTDLLDSAYYFLDDIKGNDEVSRVTETNKLAVLMQAGLNLTVDSLKETLHYQSTATGSNLLVLGNKMEDALALDAGLLKDSLLNPITFSWLYNFQLNQRHRPDSHQLNLVRKLSDLPRNQMYQDQLQFALALRMYYSGDVQQAFVLMKDLQFRSESKAGFINDILGQWSLQNSQPMLATEYFQRSADYGYLPALKHNSLASLATGQIDMAIRSYNTYRYRSKDTLDTEIPKLLAFSQQNQPRWDLLDDQQKIWYLQFNSSGLLLSEKASLLDDIQDPDLHSSMEAWLWKQALDQKSTTLLGALSGESQRPFKELQLAAITDDHSNLQKLLTAVEGLDYAQDPWVILGKALLATSQNSKIQADRYFHQLTRNPFFEFGILEAASYFEKTSEDDYAAYNTLLEALEVNRYSTKLLKAYGLECTRLNLDTYRETTLETLSGLISSDEFLSYLNELKQLESTLMQQSTEEYHDQES